MKSVLNGDNARYKKHVWDDEVKLEWRTVLSKDLHFASIVNADPSFSQSSKSSPDVGFKPSGDDEKRYCAAADIETIWMIYAYSPVPNYMNNKEHPTLYGVPERMSIVLFFNGKIGIRGKSMLSTTRIEDPDFPNKFNKVEKALYGTLASGS
ncbi:hypothetical protein Tco_1337760 [Tanacetum coccineum]